MKTISFKKFVLSRNGGAWGSDVENGYECVFCIRVADFDYRNFSVKANVCTKRFYPKEILSKLVLESGDLLIEKSGGGEKTPVGRAVLFSHKDVQATCSNFIERIRLDKTRIDPKFACYVLAASYNRSLNKRVIKQTTGIQNLDIDEYFSLVQVPVLGLDHQREVVNFIESIDSKIHTIIDAKTKQINKLNSYKQSLITKVVTKGLNPDVKLRDSGVARIGTIAETWSVVPFYFVANLERGLNISRNDYVEEGVRCLSYGDIHSKYLGFIDTAQAVLPYVSKDYLHSDSWRLLQRWDIAFADTTEDFDGAGNCTCVINEDVVFAGYHVAIARPKIEKVNPKFLTYFFLSDAFRNQIRENLCGIKVYRITVENFRASKVVLPSAEEQIDIVKFLDKKCSDIDSCVCKIKREIVELNEYRQSLISYMVSGKGEFNDGLKRGSV